MNLQVPSVFVVLALICCNVFLFREKPMGLIVWAIAFMVAALLTMPWR